MPQKIEDNLTKLSVSNKAEGAKNYPVVLGSEKQTGDLFLLFVDDSGVHIEFKYMGEMLWATQLQIAELFSVNRTVVSKHLKNIYDEGELEESSTRAKIARVQKEGNRNVTREVQIYDLNVVISVGYRVSSKQATLFRRWATDKLVQFATKGFVIDEERLKGGDYYDHFKDLRETIRDIRASETNIYREVRQICAMCSDYDPKKQFVRNIFAKIQNKLLYAVTSQTAPELIVSRAHAEHENMGLTNWPNKNIRKSDVIIAHNYLAEAEIKTKNLITTMLLDYFESRLDQGKLTTLDHIQLELDRFIKFNEYPLLHGLGSVKRQIADKHAHLHYLNFDERRKNLRHANP